MAHSDFIKIIDYNTDLEYKKFSAKLTPNIGENIGIRTPILKDFAKKESKGDYEDFFNNCKNKIYEEKLVKGFIICYIKCPIEYKLELLSDFINLIDNWALNDLVCCAFKFNKKESGTVFDFVCEYINKKGEFEKRFAVVMLLAHFIDKEHIDDVLKMLNNIYDSMFYVSMAVAWALSVCYIKFEEKTFLALKSTNLSQETLKRTVYKIKQSKRVSEDSKNKILELLG